MSENQNTYRDGLEAAHKALGVLCTAKHAAAQEAIAADPLSHKAWRLDSESAGAVEALLLIGDMLRAAAKAGAA